MRVFCSADSLGQDNLGHNNLGDYNLGLSYLIIGNILYRADI